MTLFNNWLAGRLPGYRPGPMALWLAEYGPAVVLKMINPQAKQ